MKNRREIFDRVMEAHHRYCWALLDRCVRTRDCAPTWYLCKNCQRNLFTSSRLVEKAIRRLEYDWATDTFPDGS